MANHLKTVAEAPNNTVEVQFLGEYGCSVMLRKDCGILHVCILGADDRNTVVLDTVVDLPENDPKRE